jgi:hypothetical protein
MITETLRGSVQPVGTFQHRCACALSALSSSFVIVVGRLLLARPAEASAEFLVADVADGSVGDGGGTTVASDLGGLSFAGRDAGSLGATIAAGASACTNSTGIASDVLNFSAETNDAKAEAIKIRWPMTEAMKPTRMTYSAVQFGDRAGAHPTRHRTITSTIAAPQWSTVRRLLELNRQRGRKGNARFLPAKLPPAWSPR